MSTILLGAPAVRELLAMADVIRGVEAAFTAWHGGEAEMPPKAYLTVAKGDFRAMPAALPGAAGVKWVNVHTGNGSRGLPTVMAVLVYSDPDTGYPLAVMDATEITAFRTGAAAAVASRYLARADSRTLGVIGAGRQAHTQLLAHAELFAIERVNVADRSMEAVDRLIDALPRFAFRRSTPEEAVASDIVCTLTPSRQPVVRREWVAPGTHINAVGADAEGKQELDPAILRDALVVVDDLRQSRAAGEINVALSRGELSLEGVYGTLGEIIAGDRPGRTDDTAVTVFDSTGVAIEDIAVARTVYDKAVLNGGYPTMDLV